MISLLLLLWLLYSLLSCTCRKADQTYRNLRSPAQIYAGKSGFSNPLTPIRKKTVSLFTWHLRNQLTGTSRLYCDPVSVSGFPPDTVCTAALQLQIEEVKERLVSRRCYIWILNVFFLCCRVRAQQSFNLPLTRRSRVCVLTYEARSAAGWIKWWPVSDFHQPWNALFTARQACPNCN